MRLFSYGFTVETKNVILKKKSWQKQRQEDIIYTCTSHCLLHTHSWVLIYPSSCFLDGSIKSYNREIILNLINGLQFSQLLESLSGTAPLSGGQVACEFLREPLRVYEIGFIMERRPEESWVCSMPSPHHATERWVWTGQSWTAHTSPYSIPRIYTGGDRASLLLGNSVALGSESGCVRNRDERALQRSSVCSSDGLTQPLWDLLSAGISRAVRMVSERISILCKN